ncbi:DUF421 domain-containing protein [Qipengyuania aurantiaca]|uniref:DUF421 domain-containing protein n=1 Tax=Qipengyuania aurantiaca TaxID=2867233 RepID=A0ABX8ZIL0_9SPHN|nr:YetF domain-containing protein [Qipengyuania aurantiaca]QZD88821.1 DUF421 domain-containing protein [Qipengyuania aurantiaca]
MFFEETWLDLLARGIILSFIGLVWVTLLIRIVGLRSLSKMTNFDFVMTVALGSVLANAVTTDKWITFWQCLAAMVGLFLVQVIASKIRKTSDTAEDIMQNQPVFLYKDGAFCEEAMTSARVSKSDVIAKMREANCLSLDQAQAVVLEATGDVSVLHGDTLDERILEDVKTV